MTRFHDPDRRIIPRWRSSRTTAELGELARVEQSQLEVTVPDDDFRRLLEEWRVHQSPSFAADLVGSAFLLGRWEEARDAAELILSDENSSKSVPLRRVAQAVLEPDQRTVSHPTMVARAERIRLVAHLKERVRTAPRDALAWVDLARQYTILGQSRPAEDALAIALNIAPQDRFVVRSAVRFLIHQHDAERAHHLLKRTPRTIHDPWLLASEIAAASVAERRSQFLRRARSMLDSQKIAPHHKTELAGALGTVELAEGDRRRARQLFERSLVSPNDNSLAQVSWASRQNIGPLTVPRDELRLPLTFEARAWEFLREAEWTSAIDASEEWLLDEPYSRRPARLGSFLASVILEQYERAESFANFGLDSNARDPTLLNNLAFSRASRGAVQEARQAYDRIRTGDLSPEEKVSYVATGGLLAYRSGRTAEGRELYAAAVASARGEHAAHLKAMALLYQAREELRVEPSQAVDVLGRARRLIDEQITDRVAEAVVVNLYNRIHSSAVERGILNQSVR